jgi:hypothetical protein
VLVQAEHLTKLMNDPKYDDVWRHFLNVFQSKQVEG